MRIVLTEEQRALDEALCAIHARESTPELVRSVKVRTDPRALDGLWTRLTDFGLWELADAPEHGAVAGVFEAGLACAAGGRFLCPSLVRDSLLFGVLAGRLSDSEQRRRFVDSLQAGSLRTAVAVGDPSDGLDDRPRLSAQPVGGGWSLSGTLSFVENADWADRLLVTARSQPAGEPPRLVVAAVDMTSPGIERRTRPLMSGEQFSDVTFAGVHVEAVDALGAGRPDPERAATVRWACHVALAWQCLEMVGGAQAVLEHTVAHVTERHQFGRPIGSFEAVQHHVANMRIAIDVGRLLALKATWLCARGESPTAAVARAKMLCAEMYTFTTLTAHQLHGGMGFLRESDLHLWSEAAKLADIHRGGADVAAGWLARALDLDTAPAIA